MNNLALYETPITLPEAIYLKHSGTINDIKVTIRIVDKFPVIFIRDLEVRTFGRALVHLQHIVENEICRPVEVRS
jgi:hypothetical protein